MGIHESYKRKPNLAPKGSFHRFSTNHLARKKYIFVSVKEGRRNPNDIQLRAADKFAHGEDGFILS